MKGDTLVNIRKRRANGQAKAKKSSGWHWALDIIIIFAFAALIYYVANRAGFWPFNGDSYAQATRVKFILHEWPHINWFPQWGNGMPLFLWYGILPFYLMAGLAKLVGSIELSLSYWPVICFALAGLGNYGVVYELTKSRSAALIAAFLTIPLPGLWYRALVGTHSRIFGTALLMPSVWFLVRLTKHYLENKKLDKPTLIGFIIFTTLAMQAHIFSAALVLLFEAVIILVIIPGIQDKFLFALKVLLPPLLIAAYFVFPFTITQSMATVTSGATFGIYRADPVILQLFYYHDPQRPVIAGGGLSPIHLPLLVIFLLAVLISQRLKSEFLARRALIALFILFGGFVLFGTAIYLGYPANWYNTGFVPDESFEFMCLLLPALIGILFYYSFRSKFLYRLSAIILLLIIGGWVYWQYPASKPFYNKSQPSLDPHTVYNHQAINQLLKDYLNERQYRFAHPTTEIALWFNYDYDIPQTREYFPQGILYPNWKTWFENAVWAWKDNNDEVNFLFDWFAVKWFMVAPFPIDQKYNQDAATYQLKADALKIYEYQQATPNLAPNNSPQLLVIGSHQDDRSFSPIIRGLAFANYNSEKVIPFRGKEFIDDYTLEELAKFKSVLLFEYSFHNASKAFDLLSSYVKNGGNLLIETTDFGGLTQLDNLPLPFPITSSKVIQQNQDWNFRLSNSSITKDIDFTAFSPAIFENQPWKISVPKDSDAIRPGADVILSSGDNPVIISYNLGQGKVIWSGLNLCYHIVSYKNQKEAQLMANLLDWLNGGQANAVVSSGDYEVKTINPEKREVILQKPAAGILFKENYFFDWHATVQSDGIKKNLQVYDAGPDLMYVFLPAGISYPATISLIYRKSWPEMLSNGISILAILIFIVYILEGKLFKPILPKLTHLMARPVARISRKTNKWWDKDDEQ